MTRETWAAYASPPALWGREHHVRELFDGVAAGFEFERHVNRIEWESVDAFADFFLANFPPMVTAKTMLGGTLQRDAGSHR